MQRNLYAVIPARVWEDRLLRANAKLLYGELASLSMAEGYCWATNAHLADSLGLSPKTVEGLLRQLRERGHIRLEVERSPSNQVLGRKIWLLGDPGSVPPPPLEAEGASPQECGDPPPKTEHTSPPDCGDPPLQTGRDNKRMRMVYEDVTPYSPPKGDKPAQEEAQGTKKQRRRREAKQAPDWKPERFKGFWALYPLKKSKQAAIRAWDSLRPDDKLIAVMGRALKRQMAGEDWQRGFGIPYPATWLNGSRWEDETDSPGHTPPAPRQRRSHMEVIDGEEVLVYDD